MCRAGSVSVTGDLPGHAYFAAADVECLYGDMARGLAAGGIASLGQLQLLKPLLGLGISATLLSETVSPVMIMITLGVILCVICSSRFVHQATTTSSVFLGAENDRF